MEKLFELKTKYTLEEHLKYNFAIAMKSKEVWFTMFLLLIVLIGGIISKTLYIIIFAIIFPGIYALVIYLTAKKNYLSNKAAQDAEVTIEFYSDYLMQITQMGNYKVEHDKILKIIETKTHYYIMISKNQGLLLPKKEMSEEMKQYVQNLKVN